jgi:putative oxidoreductase
MVDSLGRSMLIPLILRFGLAFIFIYSGLQKITPPGAGWGWSWATEDIKPLSPPVQMAVAWSELAGGILLGIGLLTRLAALGIALIMLGTIYWLTGAQGFKSGWDYNFAVIVMCLALVVSGGGALAVDRLIRIKRRIFRKGA